MMNAKDMLAAAGYAPIKVDELAVLRARCEELEMRCEVLLAGITDQRMIDNAERMTKIAIDLAIANHMSAEDVFNTAMAVLRAHRPGGPLDDYMK